MKRCVCLLAVAVAAAAAGLMSAAADGGARGGKKADQAVKMLDGKFDKADIKVKVGQSVMWQNEGAKIHTATSEDGTDKGLAFDTGDVAAGKDSKIITFSKAGTVKYYCKHHPKMKGSITVE